MKNAFKDTFVYLVLVFAFVLFVTIAIKTSQPTKQDLVRERDRIAKVIQNNTEITVSSEHELQIVKEILDSQNKVLTVKDC